MKNPFAIPTKEDFLEVDGAKISHLQGAQFSLVQYRKHVINMKSVIDFREFDEHMIVFDDKLNQDYAEKMNKWNEAVNALPKNINPAIYNASLPPQPVPPTIKIHLIGTMVVYQNGMERLIMMSLEDWKNCYYAYLEKMKLDY
jgi:hypothetical protein